MTQEQFNRLSDKQVMQLLLAMQRWLERNPKAFGGDQG